MRVQFTLTVAEQKRLIAKGVAARDDVKKARKQARIIFKGGTTVSAVCEELCGQKLRISGRISPKGTLASSVTELVWHCALLEKGVLTNLDGMVPETISGLKKNDIIIVGANAYDQYGQAAMMFGQPLGGGPGMAFGGMMSQTNRVIVAVSTEKFIPGSLTEIIKKTGRTQVYLAMGMAVGLTPICGEIYTEIEAMKTLVPVEPLLIGKGGIKGAEGASTYVIDGKKQDVLTLFSLITGLKGCQESGVPESFTDCRPGKKCKMHLACMYKRKQR